VWSLDYQRAIELGDADSHGSVTGAWALPNRTYAVSDAANYSLSIYDFSGALIRTVGRAGQGPGEFKGMESGFVLNEQIWIFDRVLKRFTVWALDGSENTVVSLPVVDGTLSVRDPVGVDAKGDIILWAAAAIPATGGRSRWWTRYVKWSYPENSATAFVTAPGGEDYTQQHGKAGTFNARPLFARSTAAVVRDNELILLDNESDQYRVYDYTGTLLRTVNLGLPRREISSADVSAVRKALLSAQSKGPLRKPYEQALREMPVPSVFPYAGSWRVRRGKFVLRDTEQNIWIRRYTTQSDREAEWIIVDRNDNKVGSVLLPANAEPMQVDRNRIVTILHDEDGGQRLYVYPVLAPGVSS
jgi:hypothetical protein